MGEAVCWRCGEPQEAGTREPCEMCGARPAPKKPVRGGTVARPEPTPRPAPPSQPTAAAQPTPVGAPPPPPPPIPVLRSEPPRRRTGLYVGIAGVVAAVAVAAVVFLTGSGSTDWPGGSASTTPTSAGAKAVSTCYDRFGDPSIGVTLRETSCKGPHDVELVAVIPASQQCPAEGPERFEPEAAQQVFCLRPGK